MIKSLLTHLADVVTTLRRNRVSFAVVGGIAVSFRTVARTTNDLDIAVAVQNDQEAEATVRALMGCGYVVETVIEQDDANRMATVRLISPENKELLVDLLFASSGIEGEIVASATDENITPEVVGPVADIPSLIAMKTLSANPRSRLKDLVDLQSLFQNATPDDIEKARGLVALIVERGFSRTKDLRGDLDRYIEQFSPNDL